MICTKCNTDKPRTEEYFQIRTDTLEFRKQCRECIQQHRYQYHHFDIEKTRARNRASYRKYREERIKKTAQYKRQNRKKYNLWYTQWNKEYRKNPEVRIKHNLRSRIRHVLIGLNKSESTMKLLGCSIEKLKSHLSSKFTKGMSFENYGKWHIDHVKPCVSFDLTDPKQQKQCFHYTNLQPLWAKENISKGCRI